MYWADLLAWIKEKGVGRAGGGKTVLIFSHSSETLFYRKLLRDSAYPADIFVNVQTWAAENYISINIKIVFY